MSAARRLFHHNVAGALKVGDQPLRHDLRHENVGVMDALPPEKRSAKASAAARSAGSAGVSLSASID
jgi:hypothetical protein